MSGGYRSGALWKLFDTLARLADRRWGWDRVPSWAGIAILIGARNVLRRENLSDTTGEPAMPRPPLPPPNPRWLRARSPDGSYNDLDYPEMGQAGARFGRNVSIASSWPEKTPGILEPSPRTVSRELLTRDPFQPATTVNSLAAAWLQFMIHDWLKHGPSPKEKPWKIPVAEGDPWRGSKPMNIMRTAPDPMRPKGALAPPTYTNELTHWWDGSVIYGESQGQQDLVRVGELGKLKIVDGRPPLLSAPEVVAKPGFWLGLGLMQTLFALEHNAICDRLVESHRSWRGDDDRIFDTARLVNAALMAKIHTVEWSPAVISHPTTVRALKANWWGLAGEPVKRRFGRISKNEVVSGIVGSKTDHFDVPFSLTEEFVAVYRMHPMIRDDWSFRSHSDGGLIEELRFRDLTDTRATKVLERIDMADLLYSFGTLNPGVVSLHNYPRDLQEFERPANEKGDRELMDIAAIDIMRSRELGVPRYNEFRRLIHLPPAKRFGDLTDVPLWAEEMRRVYNDDIERVDLMVGMYAEPRPRGFAFSNTALRIFILMASRRLNSDRFFTADYRPEIYTRAGLRWINENTLKTVLLRHFPTLRPALGGRENAFSPWALVGDRA